MPLLNDLYGRAWSQYQNHFRPTFKREKKKGKTVKTYEKKPQTPYPRLLASDAIPEANKARRREEHQRLDPFALKKSIEGKLKKFFPALGPLDRGAVEKPAGALGCGGPSVGVEVWRTVYLPACGGGETVNMKPTQTQSSGYLQEFTSVTHG